MLFNSHSYLLFLLIAVTLSLMTPARYRYYALCAFSLVFYGMWRWQFTFLMVFSATVDFVAAGAIHRSQAAARRKLYLVIALSINIGLLVFFKYTYFIYDNISFIVSSAGGDFFDSKELALRIILPLGISFYTFQSVSYTIDVYRDVSKPCRNFALFLAYITFWPQLVAGPILRENEIVPQLESPPKVTISEIFYGIQRIITGLFKKVVLADSLAGFVDAFFNLDMKTFHTIPGNDFLVYAVLFGFQIYLDFSGYSDIAIGSGRLLGISFSENFKWPYMARSPREFWKRWHISLSSWIRDYLYLPLTGAFSGRARLSKSTGGIPIAFEEGRRTIFALFTCWLIMGLWHGAAWTFVLWGLYHAVMIFLFRKVGFLKTLPEKAPAVSWAITTLAMMTGWFFFRAQSLEQALVAYLKIFNPLTYGLPAVPRMSYTVCFIFFIFMFIAHTLFEKMENERMPKILTSVFTFGSMAVMTFFVIIYLRPIHQFIYFQF